MFPLSWILYTGSGEHWSFKAHKPSVTKLCFSDSTLQRRNKVQCLAMPPLSPRSRRGSHCCSLTWLPSDQASLAQVRDISKSLLQRHLKLEQTAPEAGEIIISCCITRVSSIYTVVKEELLVFPYWKLSICSCQKAQLTTQWSRILSPGIPNAVQYFQVSRKVSDPHAFFFPQVKFYCIWRYVIIHSLKRNS